MAENIRNEVEYDKIINYVRSNSEEFSKYKIKEGEKELFLALIYSENEQKAIVLGSGYGEAELAMEWVRKNPGRFVAVNTLEGILNPEKNIEELHSPIFEEE